MLTAIRQWVIKTMMKNNTGVVQTLPKRDLIELNTQITAQRLMQNGIEPNSLKNADQVENAVNAIDNRPPVQEGIRSTKSAKIIDMEGKEIKDPKNIMGGKEINQQTLNEELMKTDNPFSDLVKTTNQKPKSLKEREAEILKGMEKNNKEAVQRIRNRKMVEEAIDNASPGFIKGDRKYNAQLVADDLADKRFGKEFYDLDQKQQMDLYDEALDGLSVDLDDFAQGGRAGFKGGSYDRNSFEHKINELKSAYKRYKKGSSTSGRGGIMTFEQFAPLFAKENFATGGRAGFKLGTGEKFLKFLKKFKIKQSGNSVKEFLSKRQFMKDMVGNTEKARKARQLDEIKEAMKNAKGYQFPSGKELRTDIEKTIAPILLKDRKLNATGGRIGYAGGTPSFEEYMQERQGIEKKQNFERLYKEYLENLRRKSVMEQKQMAAEGGRAGYDKGGMTRRSFLKILGGLAAVPIVGKFFKLAKVGKTVQKVPMIKTGDVPGKPEWFDALVNKVILEGDDVSKRFATQERQVVHMKKIDDETSVMVTQDLNDGSIIVDVDDPVRNVMGEGAGLETDTSVQMMLKKGQADEMTKGTPPDEFSFTENDMRNYMDGPDDYTTEFVENTVDKMSDLTSDLGKIKQYATGKKPTMKQIVESKKRKDMVKFAEERPAEYAAERGPDVNYGDEDIELFTDYASGGIARLLGE